MWKEMKQEQLSQIDMFMCKKQLPSYVFSLLQNLLLPLSEEMQMMIEMHQIRSHLSQTQRELFLMQKQFDHPLFMENMEEWVTDVTFKLGDAKDHHQRLMSKMVTDTSTTYHHRRLMSQDDDILDLMRRIMAGED